MAPRPAGGENGSCAPEVECQEKAPPPEGKLLRAKICIARSTIDEKLMNPDNFHIETRFVGLERYDTSTSRTVCTSSTY